jgi:hypothetical protein
MRRKRTGRNCPAILSIRAVQRGALGALLLAAGNTLAAPNLTPYKPTGWSDKIVVSRISGSTTDSPSLSPRDTLYVSWAVINNGTTSAPSTFWTDLLVNGELKGSWLSNPLSANYYAYVIGHSIGELGPGTHRIELIADSLQSIAETNENDNSYTKIILITQPLPSATTLSASNITPQAATLNAAVNPNGENTSAYFEYGATTSYGTRTATNIVGSGTASIGVNIPVSGLQPKTTYHYRVVADSSAGVAYGNNFSFTTLNLPLPIAVTQAASGVSANSATLHASLNPNGSSTSFYFEYGLTTSYGTRTATNSIGSGASAVPASMVLTALQPGKTYHYRVVAASVAGVTHGNSMTFTTLVQTLLPNAITREAITLEDGVILSGEVHPNNADTLAHIEYGTTTGYGNTTKPRTISGMLSFPVSVEEWLDGLAWGATYHYRIVASNSVGVVHGENITFTTPSFRLEYSQSGRSVDAAGHRGFAVAIEKTTSLKPPVQWVVQSFSESPPSPLSISILSDQAPEQYYRAVLTGANRPPFFHTAVDRLTAVQKATAFQIAASDPDAGQTLAFSLAEGSPAGASIDPATGVFKWSPLAAGVYSVTVLATDNGTPRLTASSEFTIVVNPAGSLQLDQMEPSVVLEGYNSGGPAGTGWPIALYGSGFENDLSVSASDSRVLIGPVSVSGNGRVAAFPVTVEAMPELVRGQTRSVTLTVRSGGAQADMLLRVIGLDELDLADGATLVKSGLFSRLTVPSDATVTTANQQSPDDVPNLLVTGQIKLQGTINLEGKGFSGGAGGSGGSGGTSGGGTRSGHSGFYGSSGSSGGGPFGALGGGGGAGGSGSSSFSGWSGEQGAPGANAGPLAAYGDRTNILMGAQGVVIAFLPGSGGGGGGGQGGQGGGTGSYGSGGVAGKRGGHGGGALRLRGLGSCDVSGGRINLSGLSGEISNDRGGSGGKGQAGSLWLAGWHLRTGGALALNAPAYFRLDAPAAHGITTPLTGGHGPVLDRETLPAIVNGSDLSIKGWVIGGHTVRAIVTDLETGNARHFDTPPVGTPGVHYTPFTLSLSLFGGFNRIELVSGAGLPGWRYHDWVPAFDQGLIRLFNISGAAPGLLLSAESLLAEYEEKVGIKTSPGPDPTLGFPARHFSESEPNDTVATANNAGFLDLETKVLLHGSLGIDNEHDYFLLRVPSGTITVSLSFTNRSASRIQLSVGLLDDTRVPQLTFYDWKRGSSAIRSFNLPHDIGQCEEIVVGVWREAGVPNFDTPGSYTITVAAERPGRAYLPKTMLSPVERMIGGWERANCSEEVDVFARFYPNQTGRLSYKLRTGNSYQNSNATFVLLGDQAVHPNQYLWYLMPSRVISTFDISLDALLFGSCSALEWAGDFVE